MKNIEYTLYNLIISIIMNKNLLLKTSRNILVSALAMFAMSSKAQTTTDVLEFTTEKEVGEEITFAVSTFADEGSVTVEGAEGDWTNDRSVTYKLTSKNVRIEGEGIQAFKCKEEKLTALDISKCPEINSVDVDYNKIETIDLTNNGELKKLSFRDNKVAALKLDACPALQWLACSNNKLESLDTSANPELDWLNCSGNLLKEINLANNQKLTGLLCSNMKIETLDVSMCENMDRILCQNNRLSKLDVSNNKKLTRLQCFGNNIDELNLANNTLLSSLNCSENQLKTLDVSANKSLTSLSCTDNHLTSLDLTECTELTFLYCSRNEISGTETDKLIASLYNLSGGEQQGTLGIIDNTKESDKNVCTKEQVKEAVGKGWAVKERDGRTWVDYAGSEASGIDGIASGDAQIEAIYDLSGRRLSEPRSGLQVVKMKDGKCVKVMRR